MILIKGWALMGIKSLLCPNFLLSSVRFIQNEVNSNDFARHLFNSICGCYYGRNKTIRDPV